MICADVSVTLTEWPISTASCGNGSVNMSQLIPVSHVPLLGETHSTVIASVSRPIDCSEPPGPATVVAVVGVPAGPWMLSANGVPPFSCSRCCGANSSSGAVPLPGPPGVDCGLALLLYRLRSGRARQRMPVLEQPRTFYRLEPHHRRQAGTLRLEIGDVVRAVQNVDDLTISWPVGPWSISAMRSR